MKLRTWFRAVAVALLLSPIGAQAAEEARPSVAPVAQVYRAAGSQLTVTVVRVGEKEAGEYLIQFSGVDSKFNDRIIKHRCTVSDRKTDCYNEEMREGGKYYAFVGRSGWFSSQGFSAYLPDVADDSIYLYYDRGASEQVNPEHFLTAYLSQ